MRAYLPVSGAASLQHSNDPNPLEVMQLISLRYPQSFVHAAVNLPLESSAREAALRSLQCDVANVKVAATA